MIRKPLVALILFLILGTAAYADVQPGYVRTVKRPGRNAEYLDNVQISVKGISGSFKSKKKGRFELELQSLNLKVGNPFSLSSVFKSGYELYDNNLSRVYSPGSPIEIVLRNIAQEAAEQQKFADNMYKGALAKRDSKIKELDKQLKEGKITQSKYREELQRYNDVFDKYQADIHTIAKRYAGLDYEHIDPVTEAINVAFSKGDFVLADSLLNTLGSIDAEIDANISARTDIKAKEAFGKAIVEEALDERSQNLRDAQRLAELAYAKHLSFLNNYQNDSAAYYLEKRAALLPDNVQYQIDAGRYMADYMSNYPIAFGYFNRALTHALEHYDETHPIVAQTYNNIGRLYYNQGKFTESLNIHEKTLKIRQKIFRHPHIDLATTYNNIGICYNALSHYESALSNLESAHKIITEINESNSRLGAGILNNIGIVWRNIGDYKKAKNYFHDALGIWLDLFGEISPEVALGYNNIASINSHLGKLDQCLKELETALEIRLYVFGENHPHVAQSYRSLADLYIKKRDYSKALENAEKASNIYLRLFGEYHPGMASSYHIIGTVHSIKGHYDMALENYEKALHIRQNLFGNNHPDVADCYYDMGGVFSNQGDYNRAIENVKQALAIYLSSFGENHPDVARCHSGLGAIYYLQDQYANALESMEKALGIYLSIFGENHPDVARCYMDAGELHYMQNNYAIAIDSYQKALEIQLAIFDEENEMIIQTRDKIEEIKRVMGIQAQQSSK